MFRTAIAATILIAACATANRQEQRFRSAVEAVLAKVDPTHAAVILIDDARMERLRVFVPTDRTIVALNRFSKDHPEERPPYNILLSLVEARGKAIWIDVDVQAVSHPPPDVMACGTGYRFEVTLVSGRWVIRTVHEMVC